MARSSSTEHVVIIGGGATGALTAVRLAERGFRVTVLEKAQLGNGSSSRSAAGIRAQFSTEETVVGMQYSEWWYSHFHDHLYSPIDVREQPVIAHQQNLIHAVGFSGHGLMHAPITALLVEAILAGDAENGCVRLPAPFDHATIDFSTFDPGRAFDLSHRETQVL